MPAKAGKKQRKYGRVKRKPCHQVYNAKRQWFWNKVRRIAKQMKKFPNWKPYNLSPDVKVEVKKKVTYHGASPVAFERKLQGYHAD